MNRFKPDKCDAQRHRDFAALSCGRHGLLAPTDEVVLRAAATDAEVYPAGADLVREGERLNRPRLLLEGWAARQRVLTDGRRQIYTFMLPGDAFGLSAHAHGGNTATSVALTGAVVAATPVLADAIGREVHDPLSQFAWNMILQEEISGMDQIVRLGRQTAYERVLHLMLEFFHRLSAVGLVSGTSFTMPLTQEVIADALGLSVVHTNRTLQQLRRERLIETHGNVLTLPNIDLLIEIADFRTSDVPARVRLAS
jgi:CRP-like cAMP-binding protein